MRFEPETLADLQTRLRKIEGQVRGVQRMLTEGRECDEVIHQLSAMRSALAKVALSVVVQNLEECLVATGDADQHARAVSKAKEIFLRLT